MCSFLAPHSFKHANQNKRKVVPDAQSMIDKNKDKTRPQRELASSQWRRIDACAAFVFVFVELGLAAKIEAFRSALNVANSLYIVVVFTVYDGHNLSLCELWRQLESPLTERSWMNGGVFTPDMKNPKSNRV